MYLGLKNKIQHLFSYCFFALLLHISNVGFFCFAFFFNCLSQVCSLLLHVFHFSLFCLSFHSLLSLFFSLADNPVVLPLWPKLYSTAATLLHLVGLLQRALQDPDSHWKRDEEQRNQPSHRQQPASKGCGLSRA